MSSDQAATATFALVPPTVTIVAPANGATYVQDQVVVASYSRAVAAGGTLKSCVGPVASGQRVDTHTVGPHTFTVTATDNFGASAFKSVGYTVIAKPGGGVAPVLSKVSQSATRWRAANTLPQMSAGKRVPVGTTFSFTLSVSAKTSFVFTQKTTGRKVGKNCVAETRKNRSKARCTRTVTVGTLTFSAHKGANRLRFAGRISRTVKLRPGTYTVNITATNAGKRSATAALTFTIVK